MRSLAVVADVILHLEKDEAFLLHVGTGRYFGLNRSGVVVWNALTEGNDPVEQLVARWPDRSEDALRSDADALIERLLSVRLISEVVGGPAS